MWGGGRETPLFLFFPVESDIQLGTEKEIRAEETSPGCLDSHKCPTWKFYVKTVVRPSDSTGVRGWEGRGGDGPGRQRARQMNKGRNRQHKNVSPETAAWGGQITVFALLMFGTYSS